jgi:glyoxylase-like metal-dependent hydrolase (beta-lactamase superfamily II)
MVDTALHDIGRGIFAYTQLPGSWGWSNAGLVSDGEESLLIDTLFDKKLTSRMLREMQRAAPAAKRIGRVVNTHGNGDHCYGNALVSDAEIIGTRGCVEDLLAAPASRNRLLIETGKMLQRLGPAAGWLGRAGDVVGARKIAALVEAAPLAVPLFEDFDFADNPPVPPNRTFEDRLSVTVGDKRVDIVEVGPAHTLGDAYVVVPEDRVVFTGDLLFNGAHPVMWEGPVDRWIAAMDELLELDVEVVVPGHGPLTDKSGLEEGRAYLVTLADEARRRHAAGMSVDEAARDIAIDAWRGYLDAERIYVNVHTIYRQLDGATEPADVLELFAGMARYRASVG